jgi:hypothetical protein
MALRSFTGQAGIIPGGMAPITTRARGHGVSAFHIIPMWAGDLVSIMGTGGRDPGWESASASAGTMVAGGDPVDIIPRFPFPTIGLLLSDTPLQPERRLIPTRAEIIIITETTFIVPREAPHKGLPALRPPVLLRCKQLKEGRTMCLPTVAETFIAIREMAGNNEAKTDGPKLKAGVKFHRRQLVHLLHPPAAPSLIREGLTKEGKEGPV